MTHERTRNSLKCTLERSRKANHKHDVSAIQLHEGFWVTFRPYFDPNLSRVCYQCISHLLSKFQSISTVQTVQIYKSPCKTLRIQQTNSQLALIPIVGSVLTSRVSQSELVLTENVAETHFQHDTKKTVKEWSRNREFTLKILFLHLITLAVRTAVRRGISDNVTSENSTRGIYRLCGPLM